MSTTKKARPFKQGDWVRLKDSRYPGLPAGSLGRVRVVNELVGVEWLFFARGHNCSMEGEGESCWWVNPGTITLCPQPKPKAHPPREEQES